MMTTTPTRHTPGPWENKRVPLWIPPTPTDGIPRFDCSYTGGCEWLAKAKANARLIAASPEMAYAVELAYVELAKMGCECDCENLPTSCPVCACRAALRAICVDPDELLSRHAKAHA